MRVSAILITKNAATTLRRALESLAWTDEIIVVDSGSTDDTVALARDCGAQVHVTADWPGSEERRVGKECYQPCRSRWSPYH